MVNILVCFLLLCAILLFFVAYKFFINKAAQKEIYKSEKSNKKPVYGKCVICNSDLKRGENLITKVYPAVNGTDKRCLINGCPHCFPICEVDVVRHCPVCGKKMGSDIVLVARMFEKISGKKHVHVSGCSQCFKNYKLS